MNVTVYVCFHVVSHCQSGAGGREDLSLDQDEEVQCESVRVHVTLDTVDNSQLVLSQTSTTEEIIFLCLCSGPEQDVCGRKT